MNAMEAMPPSDYAQLATKRDLDALGAELRGDMAELRGEMAELRGDMAGLRGEFGGLKGEFAELRGELKADQANLLKGVLAGQVATMMMLGAWITAVV